MRNIFYRSYKRDDFEEAAESHIDLDELKKNRINENRIKQVFKETILALLFSGITFTIAYQMVDMKAFAYQSNLKNLFGTGDKSTTFSHVNQLNCYTGLFKFFLNCFLKGFKNRRYIQLGKKYFSE